MKNFISYALIALVFLGFAVIGVNLTSTAATFTIGAGAGALALAMIQTEVLAQTIRRESEEREKASRSV